MKLRMFVLMGMCVYEGMFSCVCTCCMYIYIYTYIYVWKNINFGIYTRLYGFQYIYIFILECIQASNQCSLGDIFVFEFGQGPLVGALIDRKTKMCSNDQN